MIKTIILGIFNLITKMFDLLLSPILSAVFALFPSLEGFFSHVSDFLSMAFTYVRSILSLLLINDTMITALFDYFIILSSIHLIVLAVKFALNIYNKLKI